MSVIVRGGPRGWVVTFDPFFAEGPEIIKSVIPRRLSRGNRTYDPKTHEWTISPTYIDRVTRAFRGEGYDVITPRDVRSVVPKAPTKARGGLTIAADLAKAAAGIEATPAPPAREKSTAEKWLADIDARDLTRKRTRAPKVADKVLARVGLLPESPARWGELVRHGGAFGLGGDLGLAVVVDDCPWCPAMHHYSWHHDRGQGHDAVLRTKHGGVAMLRREAPCSDGGEFAVMVRVDA